MSFVLLSVELVVAIHEEVLNPGEIAGLAGDKSLDGALARVVHRLHYGMIGDVFDLAASYAVAIATGHCFNDENKRIAYQSMDVCLDLNGFENAWSVGEIGPLIIDVAQRNVDAVDLAAWVRAKHA